MKRGVQEKGGQDPLTPPPDTPMSFLIFRVWVYISDREHNRNLKFIMYTYLIHINSVYSNIVMLDYRLLNMNFRKFKPYY